MIEDFAGHWALHRQLIDRHGQMNGTLTGAADLQPDDAGLVYRETGQLVLDTGGAMQAERSYLWRADNDGIAVLFADGAAFHGFTPKGLSQGTPHLCGSDLYTCTYDFRQWPVWTATWVVLGERKDYTSVSTYHRA